jgi:hypothetical protein
MVSRIAKVVIPCRLVPYKWLGANKDGKVFRTPHEHN